MIQNGIDGTLHAECLFSDDYEMTVAELHRKRGEWQLHVHLPC